MHIVADIGGTNMRVAAVSGDSLGEIKKVPTPKEPLGGIKTLAALAQELADSEKVSAFAGCVPGDVSEDGVISDARNLRAWEGTHIVKEISEALGSPAQIVNDAALVGLGEAVYGAGKGAKRLAYITVSTGVGGALIVDDRIGEAGGISAIQVNGTDLEDLVSGTAVTKKFGVHPKDLDSLEEREKLADLLAQGLRAVVERWKPDCIVLGGSMIVGVNPVPLGRVQESLNTLLQNAPTIKMAELADKGGLWGGIALLRQGSEG